MTAIPAPDLQPAHPSGAVAGTYRPVPHQPVSVLMDDGTQREMEAIGWARDVSGAWRILLLYYAGGSQREDWFIFSPERVKLIGDD